MRLWVVFFLVLSFTALPAPLMGFGEATQFRFAVLRLNPQKEAPRLAGLRRLAYELKKRTSIQPADEPVVIGLNADDLFDNPFIVLPVCEALPPLSDDQVRLLRRYLDVGGFLFVDNCQARPGGSADKWIRSELLRLYPERRFQAVPKDHSLARSFYLLDRAYGRAEQSADLESIDDGDRAVILLHPNDMLGALIRDAFGNPVYDLRPRQVEMAQRQGINIAMYALTLNYKTDQIHIPFILKRRRQ